MKNFVYNGIGSSEHKIKPDPQFPGRYPEEMKEGCANRNNEHGQRYRGDYCGTQNGGMDL